MKKLNKLFENNLQWAEGMKSRDPDFFKRLSRQQRPEYLWVGCSDSRVPANEIVGLLPGDLFVHRNVANVVVHSDLNCLSVLQFAVEVLKVKHIIVCGHYGCSGIKAAVEKERFGLVDNWLQHVKDIRYKYRQTLRAITDVSDKSNKLCELNVIEQVYNICNTTVVQDAWHKHQQVTLHGWIYSIKDGVLHDLNMCIDNSLEARTIYENAIEELI